MNRVTLFGNLGADPELRYTASGEPVLNLRLATSEKWKDKAGEQKERTDWHALTVWGKRGEALSKILTKGDRILVEGSLRTTSYDDRDGKKCSKTEVNVTEVELSGKGGGSGGGSGGSGRGYGTSGHGASAKHTGSPDADDPLPF